MTGGLPDPLRRTSIVEQAIDAVRERISSGAWPVGSRIPTEPELVSAFGIGRNSLREAVRALVHAGLLETRQGDGTYVRATSDLAGALRRRATRAELVEIFEIRRALEAEAASLAAERRTAADVAELERLLALREGVWDAGDLERFIDVDVALHQAIARASGNRMLAELYDDFTDALRDALRISVDDSRCGDQVHFHDELVAAIRDRDPAAARATTVQVLDALKAQLERERAAGDPAP